MIDLDGMLEALALAGANIQMPDGLPALTGVWWMPLTLPEPAFVVAEVEIDPDITFGSGMDEVTVTCRIMTAHTDDRAASRYINLTLARTGVAAVRAAIEADKTLGGKCKTLHVDSVRGRRLFQWGGATEYLGTEIIVRVWG